MPPTGAQLVADAMEYRGLPYVLGAEGDLDPGVQPVDALDCSELVQVALADLGISFPDGHWNQWDRCILVSVDAAVRIPGALLFVYDGTTTGHVAISRGDGTTIEARGRAYGVGVFTAEHRGFTHGGLIPAIDYDPLPLTPTPQETPDMDFRILRPAGTNALFIAPGGKLPNGTWAAAHVTWLRDGGRAKAYLDAGVPFMDCGVDDLRNVPLLGDVPQGDTIAWAREMFA